MFLDPGWAVTGLLRASGAPGGCAVCGQWRWRGELRLEIPPPSSGDPQARGPEYSGIIFSDFFPISPVFAQALILGITYLRKKFILH